MAPHTVGRRPIPAGPQVSPGRQLSAEARLGKMDPHPSLKAME